MYIQVEQVLDNFSKAVKEKQYKRIDYELWRDLKQDKEVEIYLDTNSIHDYVDIYWYGDHYYETFRIDDGSLGEYLYHIFCSHRACQEGLQTFSNSISNVTENISGLKDAWEQYSKTYKVVDISSTETGYSSYYQPNSISLEVKQDNFYIDKKTINEIIDEATGASIKNNKEKDNMSNLFKNFEFGSCENDNVKMSMFGVAVKNPAGTWVAYDTKSDNVIDVDILNFSAKYLYKMPVALKDVKVGDTVIHNCKPIFVTAIEDNRVIGIDPSAGEEKAILPTTNMFGFNFITKIVNLFGDLSAGVSADSPFGNTLPLMMLADGKNDDMLPLLFMMNGGQVDMSNPMMMYFLMKDGKAGNDMLPFLMMSNFQNSLGKCSCKK